MSSFLSFMLNLFQLYSISYGLDCITVKGPHSGATLNAPSSVTCPSNYDLVSCGIKVEKETPTSQTANTYGTFIYANNNTCTTRNSAESQGTTIFARCCDLSTHNILCTQYESVLSGITDNAISSVSCSNINETLISCNTHSPLSAFPDIDGGWPGDPHGDNENAPGGVFVTNNKCTSRNGYEGAGVYATAVCCGSTDTNVNIDCISVWSEEADIRDQFANASCPSNYPIMTGCQVTSWFQNWDRAYVTDDIDAQCTVLQIHDSQWLHSVAICCRIDTISPTKSPSNNPTTNNPTTLSPTTNSPSTHNPTTQTPTTYSPTTTIPTTNNPTTYKPTTLIPTTPTLAAGSSSTSKTPSYTSTKIGNTIPVTLDTTVDAAESVSNSASILAQPLFATLALTIIILCLCVCLLFIMICCYNSYKNKADKDPTNEMRKVNSVSMVNVKPTEFAELEMPTGQCNVQNIPQPQLQLNLVAKCESDDCSDVDIDIRNKGETETDEDDDMYNNNVENDIEFHHETPASPQ